MTRHRLVLTTFGVVLSAALAVGIGVAFIGRAGADRPSRCEQFRAAAQERATMVSDAVEGPRILVIGDSYSVGLGVGPEQSWPTRLPGRVRVDGFSGSGFSRTASPCGSVSFAARAGAALSEARPDVVVVEGGLNDFDQSTTEIEAGFARLMDILDGRKVLVVGPATAPRRQAAVPVVDALLERLCAERGVGYLPMSGHRFDYLDDDLHLTVDGHRAFGDLVAGAL